MREVYDGFYDWRARIVETQTRKGPRYRAVLDRGFGLSWASLSIRRNAARGRRRKNYEEALADVDRMLDERILKGDYI